ncbi:ankyrin repeat-containing domain protein, partial [Pilaira anomala]
TEEKDLDIWKYINTTRLDIKAFYQYIKSNENSVHVVDPSGYSLLYLAASNKSMEALRILLLQPNMDVNRLNGPDSELALHAACSRGLYDAVELLLENGSIVNFKDSLGHTPLTNAIIANCYQTVELLITDGAADVSVIDEQGNSLLHLAASNGFTDVIPLLIEKGVAVDNHNSRGISPLAIAISLGYIDTAKALIDGGANVNGKTRFATVLHHAITWNRLEIVKKLVELGCDVNVVNVLEETPLYLAVQQRKIDIVRFLVNEAKADPCFMLNSPTNTTNLPLLYAANHGYTEMSKILITPKTSNFFIQSSKDMSRRVGHLDTEGYLNGQLVNRLKAETVVESTDLKDDDFTTLFKSFSDEE